MSEPFPLEESSQKAAHWSKESAPCRGTKILPVHDLQSQADRSRHQLLSTRQTSSAGLGGLAKREADYPSGSLVSPETELQGQK